MNLRPFRLLLAASLGAGCGLAQQLRPDPPVGVIGPGPGGDGADEIGARVRMFENPNLDRFLRRAQDLLAAEDYIGAIEVLQDVIDGRTIEIVDEAGAGGESAEEKKPEKEAESPESPWSASRLDAANAVFSLDRRLYRPVRRLCHELLATMPRAGIELYRTLYEVAAEEAYEEALRTGSTADLENVVNRYFITQSAGRAMLLLGDRLMQAGRYRAAVQVLRDLLEIYPEEGRRRVGVDPVWCRFKIALCLRLAGEAVAAKEAVDALAAAYPRDSLRILGELQSVKDLPDLRIFATDLVDLRVGADLADAPSWIGRHDGDTDTESPELVPLWQYRFVDPDPYRKAKAPKNQQRVFWSGTERQLTMMPFADRYGGSSWIRFVPGGTESGPPEALFLDHYRMRSAFARTGLLLREGDGVVKPARPRQGYPRIRIAACDFALMRPVDDGERRYVITGHDRATSKSTAVLEASKLVAYERESLERAWSSTEWLDGSGGLREVTFLAAPAVFGERLLLPALRAGVYSLECLDRKTGRPMWHTMLHAEGSEFFKAPGAPVAVAGGIAFVLTNAGCLAAVDALSGNLRWIRRYERQDPLRPRARAARRPSSTDMPGRLFEQGKIRGFFPNDILVAEGLVIIAPTDGSMMIAVDGASGEPVWMVDGQSRFAPYGKLETLVGANETDLFATSADALVCISLHGGLIKWYRELPLAPGIGNAGRGRGAIVGDTVLIPGEGEILAFDTGGKRRMRRLPLPRFGVGAEPLSGPFRIVSSGPLLGLGYPGGVEVFSSPSALRAVAETISDPVTKASYLEMAGDPSSAEQLLRSFVRGGDGEAAARHRACRRLLSLVRARALEASGAGRLPDALSALDGIEDLCSERDVRQLWHLARIEACGVAGDLRAYGREQQRLYDYMEGRG